MSNGASGCFLAAVIIQRNTASSSDARGLSGEGSSQVNETTEQEQDPYRTDFAEAAVPRRQYSSYFKRSFQSGASVLQQTGDLQCAKASYSPGCWRAAAANLPNHLERQQSPY